MLITTSWLAHITLNSCANVSSFCVNCLQWTGQFTSTLTIRWRSILKLSLMRYLGGKTLGTASLGESAIRRTIHGKHLATYQITFSSTQNQTVIFGTDHLMT